MIAVGPGNRLKEVGVSPCLPGRVGRSFTDEAAQKI